MRALNITVISFSSAMVLITLMGGGMLSCSVRLEDLDEWRRSQEEEARQSIPIQSLSKESLSFQILEGKEPNKYSVDIHWPPSRALVRLTEGWRVLQVSDPYSENATGFLDEGLDGGQILHYSLEIINMSGGRANLLHQDIQLPKDLMISSPFFMGEDWLIGEFRRVYINAPVTTQGKKLTIRAEQVFLGDGALIQTFPPGQKAPLGQPGRDGGQIEIHAQKAQGQLRLLLLGENGGDGLPGDEITESAPDGASVTRAPTKLWRDLLLMEAHLKDGDIFDRYGNSNEPHYEDNRRIERWLDVCVEVLKKEKGAPGSSGRAGNPGHSGGVGGNTGSFYAGIQDGSHPLIVFVERTPGTPGNPGIGGPGQPGGKGGEPHPLWKKLCDEETYVGNLKGRLNWKAPDGARGIQGPYGPVQEVGGKVEKFCVLNGEEEIKSGCKEN